MNKRFGPKEIEVIARLSYEKMDIITKERFEKFFGKSMLTRQVIYQLKKKGILASIRKGVYYYSPLEAGPFGRKINAYLIPPILFPKGNYYVGYSTMYNLYGFTDQIFQMFHILNTSYQAKRVICGSQFKLIRVSPRRMFGLEKVKVQGSEIIVSDRERTLVDLFYFPDPVGGLGQAFEILKSQVMTRKMDVKKLIKYALWFPSISTRKRIGYILEKCGILDSTLKPILKNVAKTSLGSLYGTKSRRGKINQKWKVIIDDAQR
ncbi:MAG: hypothetical protein HYS07_01825 [Chlamydiae bacterium]|nr:hypothetical protein [Chlamydiota bacterium]MBI3277300.1 hypothetical protein [Chlamydiota bacterium]